MSRDEKFQSTAQAMGYSFDGEIKIGGNYTSTVRDGRVVYLSGQIPRVGSTVVVVGRAGEAVDLEGARLGARICAMRALALLKQALGTLEAIEQIAKVNVYVQSAADFSQQSEVADAASDLLRAILGASGTHTRTSVGVFQLPKNATVELDLVAIASHGA